MQSLRLTNSTANSMKLLRHLHKCCNGVGETSYRPSPTVFSSTVFRQFIFLRLSSWPCKEAFWVLLLSTGVTKRPRPSLLPLHGVVSSEAFSVPNADVLVWIQTSSQGQHPAIYLQPSDTMVLDPPKDRAPWADTLPVKRTPTHHWVGL